MIKLIILGCFVAWMFLRGFSKSKPNSIWRIKLKRFSRYALLSAAAWFVIIAFGSVKYQVYTDNIFIQKDNVRTVFAWEENRLLPIKSFATPILLSLDYETAYPIEKKSAKSLVQKYPYEPYYLGLSQFLGTLLTFALLLSYFSRHRHTDIKWQKAVSSDSKSEYRNFIDWSNSKRLRRAHCIGFNKKALKAMQSIDQRGRLRLEMYRKGWAAQGLNAQFLDMLSKIIKSGHSQVTVKAQHFSCSKSLTEWDKVSDFINNWSAIEPQVFMEKYYVDRRAQALQNENPDKFESHVLNNPEHLRFTYPEPAIANKLLEKQLASILNQGKKRFLGDEIVQFNVPSSPSLVQPKVCLEFTYLCLLNSGKDKRNAGVWGGTINHKTITMGGTEYPAGDMLWLVFGMSFNWRLVIDGAEIAKGQCVSYPDSNVCNLSRPTKRDMPVKSEVEKHIFDVVALSNVSAFFAQIMGMSDESINKHIIDLNQTTALEVKRQTTVSKQLAETLEDALRGEALEELMLSSGTELYKQNKEMVDAVIRDYIKNHGDTDTVMMIIDLLGDAAPELASSLLQIIGDSDE